MDVLNYAASVCSLLPTSELLQISMLTSFLVGNEYSWSVLQCSPGQFCCRAASDNDNCCSNNASMISTSHIGNLLLPGSTAAVNTTYNVTTEAPAAESGSPSSNSSSAFDASLCPTDNTALVGGTLGGILGAALIGALLALAFALRSRKQTRAELTGTRAALTTMETQTAEVEESFQKQLESQQRRMQSTPPTYHLMSSNGAFKAPGMHGYTTAHVTELPHSSSSEYSELGGSEGRVELISETPKIG